MALAACGGGRGPTGYAVEVFEQGRPPRAALPDETERAAGELAALVLAGRADAASQVLSDLEVAETARRSEGRPPSGLLDNVRDLLHALDDARRYERYAERALDAGGQDPVLERRLEQYVESRPLRRAERRVSEDRQTKLAAAFNRLVAPASRFLLGGTLHPIDSGRAVLSSLLVLHSLPTITVQERQALRAYEDFVARYPDAPEAPEARERIARYREKQLRHLHEEALGAAERALESGRPDVALAHLERAERLVSGRPEAERLRVRARDRLSERRARQRSSAQARALVGIPLDAARGSAFEALVRGALVEPPPRLRARIAEWEAHHPAGPLTDELLFLDALDRLERGEETRFFEAMEGIARLPDARSNMSRHARRLVHGADSNPYRALELERAARGRALRGWLFLGKRAGGPLRRDLPAPLEWILDLPGMAISLATFPFRAVRYPQTRLRLSGGVLHAGERYLQRFPGGEHAEEVHRELEGLYAGRGSLSRALAHHEKRARPDPRRVARYREQVAERTIEAARHQRRFDIRVAIYRMIVDEYHDTPPARAAAEELQALLASYTPQHIRLSRAFLEEQPELWGPGALGLRPALLDGEAANGEIAEEGITLLGQRWIRIALQHADPVVEQVPRERFSRFIATLEHVSYRTLVTDEREVPVVDPQRDLFFERARLGLLDEPDVRPTASSEAEFLAQREKYGLVKSRESVLPVELVLQGGLEDFGVSAFPRIRTPPPSRDAFLYE